MCNRTCDLNSQGLDLIGIVRRGGSAFVLFRDTSVPASLFFSFSAAAPSREFEYTLKSSAEGQPAEWLALKKAAITAYKGKRSSK
jgi:hypothetical protein